MHYRQDNEQLNRSGAAMEANMKRQRVGFIGLGLMGRGMARSLLKAGVSLVVYDLDPEAVKALVDAGAEAATSVAGVAGAVDVVFTSLPGPTQVEQVVFGAQGILDTMAPGLVMFEMSTSSLSLNRRIHGAFKQRNGHMLDAPISGGPAGAANRDLAVWIGGDRDVYERHLDLLQAIGDKVQYVGPSGAGTVAKLTHNMAGFMILQTMAEVFSVGVKAGVDPLDLWQALRLGSAGKRSPLALLTNQFLPGQYEKPAFALKLAHKDVGLGTALEEMTEAMGRGWGEQDARAYLKLQLERAGVEIAVDPERLREAIEAAGL
jgi:3-hydroxyisobutyrate dehydrogenase